MYDTLLFLHVLAAFALVTTVVVFSAFALGASPDSRVLSVGNVLWTIGGLGTIIFGVWLALYVNGYEIWDGWIITAIVLWAIATELGRRAQVGYVSLAAGEDAAGAGVRQAATMHWLRTVVVLGLLVVMVYKPGA
ncbi:MAG TPA: hypothetical protein VH391_00765 [Solirubrobacterales bacterium]